MRQLPLTGGVIFFVNQRHALDIGPEVLNLTDDGGATWSPAPRGPLSAGWAAASVVFTDQTHGFLLAADSPDADYFMAYGRSDNHSAHFRLLTTSDGGFTWHQVVLPRIAE